MKFKLEVQERAAAEVATATRWYRARSAKAAKGFVSALTEAYGRLKKYGDAYRFYNGSVRLVYLKKYPYLTAYVLMDGTVSVLSVLHKNQDRDAILEGLAPQ